MLIIVGSITMRQSIAEAAEDGMYIVPLGGTTEVLTDEDFTMISQEVIGEDISLPMLSNSSYTAYRYTDAFDFYFDGQWVARADVECIVWHYTDGKVHLYSRTISVSRLTYYDAARIYGSIVNTDGSYSYTTGDRVHLYLDAGTWSYAIDFYVDANNAYFTCYEV